MKFSLQLGKLALSLAAERSYKPSAKRSSDPISSWLRGQDLASNSAAATLVSPFQQSVWVYTVVSALAQTVSAIPFRISRGDRSGETLVTKGPVVDLFNRPHEYLNRFRFWEFIVTWYCLRGEVFLVALDKSGNVMPIKGSHGHTLSRSHAPPVSLLVLPPDQFRHIVHGYELAGWQFYSTPLSGPLPPQYFTPDEVLHDFLPNPYLFWRGMSPLSVAMLAAQTDYASAQFMKGLMLNNADTGVIVRTDQQLSEEQREQIKAALDARKRSAGTADRPLLLWGGTDIVKPTLSSADLQFLEHRKFNRQEICAAFFRMPQSLVGFTEDANRAIHQSERLNFIENSITPFCARLEAAVEPIVKSFGPDLVGWFDMDSLPILQQARRDRVDTGVKLFALGYPANAINKSLDLGLPHLDWGDKGYLPFTLQEAGSGVEPAPSPDANIQSAPPIERMLHQLRSIVHPSDPSATSEPAPLSSSPEERAGERSRSSQLAHHQCSASPAYEALLKPRIKKKRKKLSAFFFDQRNRVLAKLEESKKHSPRPSEGRGVRGEGDCSSPQPLRSSAETSVPSAVKPCSSPHDSVRHDSVSTRGFSEILNLAEETKLLVNKLTPLLRSDLELGFNTLTNELAALDLSLSPDQILTFLAQRATKLAEVNQTTFNDLSASLQEGASARESVPALASRVKQIFQDASDRRADVIALTETTTAMNTGRFFGMQTANVKKKGWVTANDEKVRPAHAQAQVDYSKGIPLDQPFIVGGEELMYPGDPNGSAGNIINCRCGTFPIVDEQ